MAFPVFLIDVLKTRLQIRTMPPTPSAATQVRWARQLRYFSFHPSPGGHGDCPETLSASIAYSGIDELLSLFVRMGRPLSRLPEGATVPVHGKTYTGDEWSALKHPITAWPDYEDPRIGPLLGIECVVSITGNKIAIYLSGGKDRDFWSVSETDYINAQAIERAFDELGITPMAADLAIDRASE